MGNVSVRPASSNSPFSQKSAKVKRSSCPRGRWGFRCPVGGWERQAFLLLWSHLMEPIEFYFYNWQGSFSNRSKSDPWTSPDILATSHIIHIFCPKANFTVCITAHHNPGQFTFDEVCSGSGDSRADQLSLLWGRQHLSQEWRVQLKAVTISAIQF